MITRTGNNMITSTSVIDTNNEIDDRNSIFLIFLIELEENIKMTRNEIATMTEQTDRTITMTRDASVKMSFALIRKAQKRFIVKLPRLNVMQDISVKIVPF